jgi:hypothetical protein
MAAMKTDDLLIMAARLVEAGECEDAAKLLGDATMMARGVSKTWGATPRAEVLGGQAARPAWRP